MNFTSNFGTESNINSFEKGNTNMVFFLYVKLTISLFSARIVFKMPMSFGY